MKVGIEHVAIYAKDTKALSEWYMDMFCGRKVYENVKSGTCFVAFDDGSMIEFCQNAEGENEKTEKNKLGIRHIAFSIDDFEGMCEKLKGANVEIITEASVSSKGIKTIFFRDIEGNILHLIYRPEPLV